MKKKVASLLIVATLVSAVSVPAISYAAEAVSINTAVAAVAGGECGGSLKWTLDENGVIAISGSGPMINYSGPSLVPWYQYRDQIKRVSFSNMVTMIGDYAFYDCQKITAIDIPYGVTRIGSSAFNKCLGLKTVSLPKTVTNFDGKAFDNCNSIREVYFAGSKTEWDSIVKASGNEDIRHHTIHDKMVYGLYGDGITWTIDLTKTSSITVEKTPLTITGSGDFWVGEAGWIPYADLITDVIIEDGITEIPNGMFSEFKNLKNVTIPSTVMKIGEKVFFNSNNIANITYKGTTSGWDSIAKGSVDANTAALKVLCDNKTETVYNQNNDNTSVPQQPSDEISVYVNGAKVKFEVQPTIVDGNTLVPMRAIFEALGAKVEWNGATKTVTAVKDKDEISLTIDKPTINVNGTAKTLEVAPTLLEDSTFVPVRAISEALGSLVAWDGVTRTITITD